MPADYTLSDMPDTLGRVDTAGAVDGASYVPFGGSGGVTPRSGGAVYVKGPMTTFQFFDSGSMTLKTIEVPTIRTDYVGADGDHPDLCRIVTLPVLGPRAIIWHAGHVGIYAAGVVGTPNAARCVPLIRGESNTGTYLNGGSLFVPNAGPGAGDCRICPFPIVTFIADGFGGVGDGFASWGNMPWLDATWMLPDPTGGVDGGLPYPYSISPWVEAGYGDAYQGSIPNGLLEFAQPGATAPTVDVQELIFPHPGTIKVITITVPSAASTSGMVLVPDPAVFGTPDYFASVSLHVAIFVPGQRTPIITDSIPLAGLTTGPDIVRQYFAVPGTYIVYAYYVFGFGSVVMYSAEKNAPTILTLP